MNAIRDDIKQIALTDNAHRFRAAFDFSKVNPTRHQIRCGQCGLSFSLTMRLDELQQCKGEGKCK